MGWIPPPPPIDVETMLERMRNGARTMAEIDPEFWEWKQQRDRDLLWSGLSLVVAIVVGIGTICMVRYTTIVQNAQQTELKAEADTK